MSDQDAAARLAVLCAVSALNCVMATAVGMAVFGVGMCILLAILDNWSPWPPHKLGSIGVGAIWVRGDEDAESLADLRQVFIEALETVNNEEQESAE